MCETRPVRCEQGSAYEAALIQRLGVCSAVHSPVLDFARSTIDTTDGDDTCPSLRTVDSSQQSTNLDELLLV